MTEVTIVQRRLTNYRAPLFERLRLSLAEQSISLRLLVGTETQVEGLRNDGGHLVWAEPLPTRYFARGKICWQPFARRVAHSDLVILTQENKLIQNHLLFLHKPSFRLAFWGHGANMQGRNRGSYLERYKSWTSRRVDWWFAYTEASVNLITKSGFPADRITVLNNSVDTQELTSMRICAEGPRLAEIRSANALWSKNVGIFLGSLYREKNIGLVLESALLIRKAVPDFELLIVGDGELRGVVTSFCRTHPWAKYMGSKKGQEKVDLLALAKVMLSPGAIGLSVLDSFVCGVPIVTTHGGLHGPEFAYLTNHENCIISPPDATAYASSVTRVLMNDALQQQLGAACLNCAQRYSLEKMVDAFVAGIRTCLSRPRYIDC